MSGVATAAVSSDAALKCMRASATALKVAVFLTTLPLLLLRMRRLTKFGSRQGKLPLVGL